MEKVTPPPSGWLANRQPCMLLFAGVYVLIVFRMKLVSAVWISETGWKLGEAALKSLFLG